MADRCYFPRTMGREPASGAIRRLRSSMLRRCYGSSHHWRWLVLGAVGVGLAGAILFSLLTRRPYRSWVTLEGNPPSVAVSEHPAAGCSSEQCL